MFRSILVRPVRSGLPPPPSRPANLYREETRAGFPYDFRGFARALRDALKDIGRNEVKPTSALMAQTLFLGQYPQALQFERFIYLYTAERRAAWSLALRGRVTWHDSDRFDGTVRAANPGSLPPSGAVRWP